MTTVAADTNDVKPSSKVRIIGKIRSLTDKGSESLSQNPKPWITVKKTEENGSSEKCKVFFESQSSSRQDVYELDYCYEQHEEIDQLYSREIHPLILEVFNGRNASIIALGARRSGKTYIIQGSKVKYGLASQAMTVILSMAKELGRSVFISLYEITHESIKDLLNAHHPAIQLLEDGNGKMNIKGLSQVPVKTDAEFHDMYFSHGCSQNTKRKPMDQPHKGLMVHILSNDGKGKAKLVNKVNFVDLAGYEDLRKSSRDGITSAGTNMKNKSLYALLNVVSAINANEMRVPYRESKLTRILQDSLGGTSHVLLITCLKPFFCQDSLGAISLASRSCRSTKQVLTDSTNRGRTSAKVKEVSSLESGKKMSASLSVKKQLSTKKANCILKARTLFDEVRKVNSKQAPQDKSVAECSSSMEVEQIEYRPGSGSQSKPKLENILLPSAINDEPTITMKSDISLHSGIHNLGDTPDVNLASTCEENHPLLKKENGSPPLSSRIREIYNNLKAFCESTPSTDNIVAPYNRQVGYNDVVEPLKTPSVAPYNSQVGYTDILEPKTPAMELNSAKRYSPRGSFSNHGSKIKDSLVKEYLNYLNSANKEQLKTLQGIGEKRATYILEMREESPEPFKSLDDLKDIGVSAKQIKGMLKQVAGGLFD